MGKNFSNETKRKAEEALLKAERELIYCQDIKKKFESDPDTIIPDHINKDLEEKIAKAKKVVERAEKYLKKVDGTRIDPLSVPSKMEEKEKAIEELNESVSKRKIEFDVTEHEKYSGPIARTREATHDLKSVIPNLSKEIKFQNIGFGGEAEYSDFVARGTYDKILFDPKDGTRDPEIVKAYYKKLENNQLTAEPYFTESDGEIYYFVNNFFKAKQSKTDREFGMALAYLQGFCNTLVYYVANIEKSGENNEIRKAYLSGKTIKVMPALNSPVKFSILGKGWNRNPLKEAAWITVHSYLINMFLNESDQYKLIPKNKELVPMWNNYISMMDDVPDLVKKYYYLNDDCESIFTRSLKKSIAADIVAEKTLKNDHPVDDHEEGAIPFEEAVVVNIEDAIKSSAEDLKTFKATIDNTNENVIDGEFKPIVPITEEHPSQNSTKEEEKKESKNPSTPIVEQEKKPVKRIEEQIPDVAQNNTDWEYGFDKLYKFTDLVRKNNLSVMYGRNPRFPLLIQAVIFNKNRDVLNSVLIDPCIIYGDTYRAVTMSSIDADLRKEAFVAFSQKEAVEKIILNTFSMEDKKKNNEQLPRCMTDFREKYTFIDRIDMKDLQTLSKKPDGRSISFNEWKKLVINISNVLRNQKDIPICRFRLSEYTNCNKFKMICDDKVQITYATDLIYQPSQQAAMNSMFWVDYDSEQYKDSNYIFGSIKPIAA